MAKSVVAKPSLCATNLPTSISPAPRPRSKGSAWPRSPRMSSRVCVAASSGSTSTLAQLAVAEFLAKHPDNPIALIESAMLAAGSMIEQEVPPFCTVSGDRARLRAVNRIGLERRGVDDPAKAQIKTIFKQTSLIGNITG